MPNASSLNFAVGQTIGNMITAKVSPDGKVKIHNRVGTTHVVADVAGWFSTGSDYEPLTPARILDTRAGQLDSDGHDTPVGPGQTIDVTVTGVGGVPATGAGAVALNLTVVGPTAAGYLTNFPTGVTRPETSSLLFSSDQIIANEVIAKVGADGKVSILNAVGSTDVLADVVGWFPTAPSYSALTPARILDTRPGPLDGDGHNTAMGPGQTIDVTVTGVGGVPVTGVGSVVLDLSVVDPTSAGYVTAYPTGTVLPVMPIPSFAPGQRVTNKVIATVGGGGKVSIYNNSGGSTHVQADVVGWFPTGDVTVVEENGSKVRFTSSAGTYIAPSFVFASLVRNGDGTFTFTRRKRERFVFSSGGRLLEIVDLNNYATTLAYNAEGQLATVTDPAGRALTFTYGANGKVASASDPIGRRVSYGYDAANRLTSVTDVGGGVTRFGYDGAGRVTTMTDPRGGVVTNTYDSSARVTQQTDARGRKTTFAYDSARTTVTDPKGNVEVQGYTDGQLTALTKGVGTAQAATWTFTYDPATLGRSSATDPNNHTQTMTYDAGGNLTSHTDALGRRTSFAYDALNDLTSATDAAGVTTTFTYDGAGNLTRRARPLTATGQNQVVSYAYGDPARPGDVTSLTDPVGKVWGFGYDAAGNLTRATDPLANTTTSATTERDGAPWR